MLTQVIFAVKLTMNLQMEGNCSFMRIKNEYRILFLLFSLSAVILYFVPIIFRYSGSCDTGYSYHWALESFVGKTSAIIYSFIFSGLMAFSVCLFVTNHSAGIPAGIECTCFLFLVTVCVMIKVLLRSPYFHLTFWTWFVFALMAAAITVGIMAGIDLDNKRSGTV